MVLLGSPVSAGAMERCGRAEPQRARGRGALQGPFAFRDRKAPQCLPARPLPSPAPSAAKPVGGKTNGLRCASHAQRPGTTSQSEGPDRGARERCSKNTFGSGKAKRADVHCSCPPKEPGPGTRSLLLLPAQAKAPYGTGLKSPEGTGPQLRQELGLQRCLEALALSAAESAARSTPVVTADPLECEKVQS